MKDYKRLTRKKEITECEIVDDKRYSVGFKQIPHKINKNIIKGIYTICNDLDGQGDYIKGDIVDKIAALEDKIESGEIVDRNSYLDYLLAEKDASELTDKEIEFFVKHNARVRGNADVKIAHLTAENTKLCERLNRAAELPCKVGDTLYEPFIDRIREWIVDSIYVFSLGINVNCERKDDCRWHDHFAIREKSNDFESRVYLTREAAESRLAEIKGGKE